MPQPKKKVKREKLIDIIKRELRARGYREVEPNPHGGGVWSHEDEEWTDRIVAAIQDCFDREDHHA